MRKKSDVKNDRVSDRANACEYGSSLTDLGLQNLFDKPYADSGAEGTSAHTARCNILLLHNSILIYK